MHVKYAFLHCSYAVPVRVSIGVEFWVVVARAAVPRCVVAARDVVARDVVAIVAVRDVVFVGRDVFFDVDVGAVAVVVAARDAVVRDFVFRADVVVDRGVNVPVRVELGTLVVIARCVVDVVVDDFVRETALPSRNAATASPAQIAQYIRKIRIPFISGKKCSKKQNFRASEINISQV